MSRSVPVNADSLGPARPAAVDVAAGALDWHATIAAPRPRAGRGGTWPNDLAHEVLHALKSAGFLVVHQDALPADVLAAVAGHQDSP